ncbi:MAG TPA: 2-oxoacid:acceptor oxidoreductase [Clostridiales bacterium]|nr:2-oxoacid:acceptor oxidoreductase [Clostridiales bacterium]
MALARFNEDRCKGCKLCLTVCPKKIIVIRIDRLNEKGYHPAGLTEPQKCIGCAFCAMMCPDCVIEVEK